MDQLSLLRQIWVYLFVITVYLSSSSIYGQSNFCILLCDEPEDEGCYTCDLNSDFSGSYPWTIWTIGSIQDLSPICDPWNPNNTLWIAFVAGSSSLEITVAYDCIDNGTLQVGLVTDCGDSECIVEDADCTNNPLEISTDELIPGNTYFLWLDGCAGSVCNLIYRYQTCSLLNLMTPIPSQLTAYAKRCVFLLMIA